MKRPTPDPTTAGAGGPTAAPRIAPKIAPKIAHYYGRLKVATDAPPEVIRAAYKVLVQKYHPDRHRGSVRHEIVLTALNKAQEVLLDPARRAAHDQWIREEEIRLGLRAAGLDDAPPGLLERWDDLREGMRVDGLRFDDAWRMHFTRRQRLGAVAGCTLAVALLLFGVMLVVWPHDANAFAGVSRWP